MKKIIQFVRECITELKRVSWPSRSEVLSSVRVVFISTIICAIILGALDFLFTTIMRHVF